MTKFITNAIYKFKCYFFKFKPFLKRIIKNKYLYLIIRPYKPLSNLYGLDRGKAIDRYYIEKFLLKNTSVIRGRCLELLNNNYTKQYGGGKVVQSDVLDIESRNQEANIVGDIRRLHMIGDNTYDCIILTQTLHFIDDFYSVIKECRRILKKSGVILVTLPSISRIDCVAKVEGDFWRFTLASARYVFEKYFLKKNLEIRSWGNVKVGCAFLIGLAQEEVSKGALEYNDPDFPCLITVKAIK